MRTLDEVKAMLEIAKLNPSELLPISQELVYDEHFPLAQLKLLELEPGVEEAIQIGQSLVIRGDGDDRAVLCTGDATYEVKDTETSNSFLLMENLELPTSSASSGDKLWGDEAKFVKRPVLNVAGSYFELCKVNPNLNRIESILEATAYRGPEHEEEEEDGETKDQLITMSGLLERIPASVGEIETFLEKLHVVKINGFLRILDEDYLFRVLSLVLNLVDSDESSTTEGLLDKDTILSILRNSTDEPSLVFDKILEWFFIPSKEEPGKLLMNEREICRFIGICLLKPKGRFQLKEFLKAWSQTVPDCLKTDVTQLDGVCLVDKELNPPQIWHFTASSLPESIPERFAYLFEAKSKWSLEEIRPFIDGVISSRASIGALLTKYARVSTSSTGSKIYTARHVK